MSKIIVEVQGKKFVLEHPPKIHRAINGDDRTSGVGEENQYAILVEYDRLGGLITYKGKKVATGSFYDFRNKKAKTEDEVTVAFAKKPGAKEKVESVGDASDEDEEETEEDSDEEEESEEDADAEDADEDEEEAASLEKPKKKKAAK